jgi:hypothetical protein
MSVHVRCWSIIGETLVIKCVGRAITLALVSSLCAVGSSHAADLLLEKRDGKWLPITAPTPAHPAPPAVTSARPKGVQPAQSQYEALTIAARRPDSSSIVVRTSERQTEGSPIARFFFGLQIGFGLCLLVLGLANLRRITNLVDRTFAVDWEVESPTAQHPNNTEAVATALARDLQDYVQSSRTAAHFEKQTEVLRAMKADLDAEADAAYAAIRSARAEAQTQPGKETA